MKQEQHRSDGNMGSQCFFHPPQSATGICALCLNEKLLVLAAKQDQTHSKLTQQKAKIFALASLRHLLEIKLHRANHHNPHTSSTSPEDSFISIKFEDNGVASWDKGEISKMPLDESWDKVEMTKSVGEHAKPRAPMRWWRRIIRLFRLTRWKRPSDKGNTCSKGVKLKRTKS